MSRTIERDVIVVGAGPGGSAAAGYLAKQGVDVLMLDKETFPRDKPCGEGQTPEAYLHYKLLGCFDEYMSIAHPLRGLIFWDPEGNSYKMEEEESSGGVCPRRSLDNLMRQNSEKLGADVIEDCWVYDVIKEGDQVVGVKAKYQGEYIEIRGKIVIGADGSHSMVAKKTNNFFDGDGDEMTISVVARCHYTGVKDITDLSELFFDKDILPGYVWIFPYEKYEKGFCNVGIGFQRGQYETAKIGDIFDMWLKKPEIARRFKDAKQVGPLQGWRIPQDQLQNHTYGNGVMLIGDAAAQNTPSSGEGISLAMNAGCYASIAAMEALKKKDYSITTLKIYDDLIQKWHTPYYKQMRSLLNGMANIEGSQQTFKMLASNKEASDKMMYLFGGGSTANGVREYFGLPKKEI